MTRAEVENILLHPLAVKETRYGRKAAYGAPRLDSKHTVVIFEENDEEFIVVTAMKVDKERLERYGFTGVR